jgi:hypothetical protein
MLLIKSISYLLAIFAIISSCIAVAGFDMVSTVVAVRSSLNAQDETFQLDLACYSQGRCMTVSRLACVLDTLVSGISPALPLSTLTSGKKCLSTAPRHELKRRPLADIDTDRTTSTLLNGNKPGCSGRFVECSCHSTSHSDTASLIDRIRQLP